MSDDKDKKLIDNLKIKDNKQIKTLFTDVFKAEDSDDFFGLDREYSKTYNTNINYNKRSISLDIKDLLDRTIIKIDGAEKDSEAITLTDSNGDKLKFLHKQDCCENVRVEDICGDIKDLLDSPILLAEEVTEEGGDYGNYESYTWTFYKLATIKGSVTIRWLGESNGYYSEKVDLVTEETDAEVFKRVVSKANLRIKEKEKELKELRTKMLILTASNNENKQLIKDIDHKKETYTAQEVHWIRQAHKLKMDELNKIIKKLKGKMSFIMNTPHNHISDIIRSLQKQQEDYISKQLSELVSRGLLVIESRMPVLTQCQDSNEIKISQAIKLVPKEKEYIESLEKENKELKEIIEKLKGVL